MRIQKYNRVKRRGRNLAKKSRVMAYAEVVSDNASDYQSEDEQHYTVVRYHDRTYGCDCPSKLFRRRQRCKHIRQVIEYERKGGVRR